MIIVDDGIVVKQVTSHGIPKFFTTKITKIASSHRDILGRIKQIGRLARWDPDENLPCDAIDEEGGAEDVELIFKCEDILGHDWMGRDRDFDSDDPTAQASRQAAKRLDAASKRVDRFNAFGRKVTGQSIPWIEKIEATEATDGEPTWRILGIFYDEF